MLRCQEVHCNACYTNVSWLVSEVRVIVHCIGDSHASFFSGFDCIIPEWPQKGNNFFRNIKAIE